MCRHSNEPWCQAKCKSWHRAKIQEVGQKEGSKEEGRKQREEMHRKDQATEGERGRFLKFSALEKEGKIAGAEKDACSRSWENDIFSLKYARWSKFGTFFLPESPKSYKKCCRDR